MRLSAGEIDGRAVDPMTASVEEPRHRLADFGRGDRLAELSFDMPLLDTSSRVAVRRLGSEKQEVLELGAAVTTLSKEARPPA